MEVIRAVVENARDADKVAAIAGALAGATHGRTVLPSLLIDAVPAPIGRLCKSLAVELAALPSARRP